MKYAKASRMRRVVCAIAMLTAAVTTGPVFAVQPDEVLADSALEARARALSQRLRCVVCQNQSIDDSNAPLARDLRIIVRERLTAGDTDDQAVGYLVARYGNFVLLRPPFQSNTVLLWFGPLIVLLVAAGGFGAYLRRRRSADVDKPDALSEAEKKRIESLVKDEVLV